MTVGLGNTVGGGEDLDSPHILKEKNVQGG